jgi:hypothetical protein
LATLWVAGTNALAGDHAYTLSDYPPPGLKPDGTRDPVETADISGTWKADSGAAYGCNQKNHAVVCVYSTVTDNQQALGIKVGDVAFVGNVYEHVAEMKFLASRFPQTICPANYIIVADVFLRVSDDFKEMQGELLRGHVNDDCVVDGATVQGFVLGKE